MDIDASLTLSMVGSLAPIGAFVTPPVAQRRVSGVYVMIPCRAGQHLVFLLVTFWALPASGDIQKILVEKEIDDDHIIVITERGERLFLEKWTLRFSPALFEGKYFIADVSALWVTIHFDDREPLKWSVEQRLGIVQERFAVPTPKSTGEGPRKNPRPACYETSIQNPAPYNGNGGEVILLADGSIWQEVSYQYLYLYEYYPSVIVCPSEGKMILGEHIFQIVRQN
jgi:hypothetical protein